MRARPKAHDSLLPVSHSCRRLLLPLHLPGFTDLYLGAMDAIWAMTPGAPIFVVEGAGQVSVQCREGPGLPESAHTERG